MKKIQKFILLAVVLYAIPQLAYAGKFPVAVGDTVKYTRPNGDKAAAVTVAGVNTSYDAFCIEWGVDIKDGSSNIVSAVGKKSLSDKVKWLYAAFYNYKYGDLSTFAGVKLQFTDKDNGRTYTFGSVERLVQYGIWYNMNKDVSLLREKKKMAGAWNQILQSYWASSRWADSAYQWDIRSVEFSADSTGKAAQAQVIGVKNPAAVPEPATMALMGIGLMGIAGAARRRSVQLEVQR